MVADEWRENFRMSRSSIYKHGHFVKPLTKIEKSSCLVSTVETERKRFVRFRGNTACGSYFRADENSSGSVGTPCAGHIFVRKKNSSGSVET